MIGIVLTELFAGMVIGWISGTIEAYSKRLWYACFTLLAVFLAASVLVVGTKEIASGGGWELHRLIPFFVGLWSGEAVAKIAYREAFGGE